MNVITVAIGNQIERGFRDSRESSPISRLSRPELHTLQQLLAALAGSSDLSMLQTTAGHISRFLDLSADRIPINALQDLGAPFRLYLEERRYKRNAVRSYSNFSALLLRKARELGWVPARPEVSELWKPVLAVMPKESGCNQIVNYAIRQGKRPSDFSDHDLDLWAKTLLNQGRAFEYVRTVKRKFRQALSQSGLSVNLPGISGWSHKLPPFGVPFDCFPTELRGEVEALLKWKQDPYAEGRPRRGRHRAVSARHLAYCIRRLYGFVKNVDKRTEVQTLVQLVTKKSVANFIKWSLNDRRVKSSPFAGELGLLCAAIRQNPVYKTYDWSWLSELVSQIQPDPQSEIQERKASKYLPYEIMERIPQTINQARQEVGEGERRRLAFYVHDELLLLWWVTLAWRQRNIRECRLGANLFKAELTPFVNVAKPRWVQERIAVSPHEEFWQFHFREGETKTHHEIRSILPLKLVPLLEEYVERHRAFIVPGTDSGHLFLTRNGRPLQLDDVTRLIGNLTLKYAHRRVTPHIIRDIFAFYWLEHHPEDYLTVSKVLWHKDINTTLRIYGCKFDESHGLRRVEDWLDQRAGEPGQVRRTPIAESTKPGPQIEQGQNRDYKAGYLMQHEINKRLTDRVEQLEKQLRSRGLGPPPETDTHRQRTGAGDTRFRRVG